MAETRTTRIDPDAERVACPGCGTVLERTLDENCGELRFRCEPCDVEECGHGDGAWAHYFHNGETEYGWAHIDDTECFLNPPAPWPFDPSEARARLAEYAGGSQ